jgi:hypothetical protein
MKAPALFLLLLTLVCTALAAASPAVAQPTAAPSAAPPAPTPAAPSPPPPTTSAAAALDRANAAYEYGDMKEVVESARPVVDGATEATPAERLQALRFIGIGLYLTGRPTGAEGAFLELLRSRPKARLDPTTTRPEVVAFFEDVRRRHRSEIEDAARARTRRSLVWCFLPPVGQFKNGDPGRGTLFLALEVTSAAAAITTKLMLESWRLPNNTSKHPDAAETLRIWNFVSVGVLAASYTAGVIDALLRSDREPADEERAQPVSFFLFPGGAGLSGRF